MLLVLIELDRANWSLISRAPKKNEDDFAGRAKQMDQSHCVSTSFVVKVCGIDTSSILVKRLATFEYISSVKAEQATSSRNNAKFNKQSNRFFQMLRWTFSACISIELIVVFFSTLFVKFFLIMDFLPATLTINFDYS